MDRGEIVLYQPDDTVLVEVRLENENAWLTQAQIADLFGTTRSAITKQLANIFKSGELIEDTTCSILEHMGNDGKQIYRTKFYNDRFLVIDDAVYHIGASLKDLGKKLFAFSKMEIKSTELLKNI